MPKKLPNEAALVLRRMPIVVIPRKRKYKNYVSRRRNTHLFASLRKCVSDPLMYRSFNHWKSLWREFSPSEDLPLPSADIPRLIDEGGTPRTPVVTTVVVSPTVDAKRSPLVGQVSEKITHVRKNEVSQVSLCIPLRSGKGITVQSGSSSRKVSSPRTSSTCPFANTRTLKKQALNAECPMEEYSNNSSEENDNKVRLSIEFTTVKGPTISALVKSGAPSPASFPKSSPVTFGEITTMNTNNKARDPPHFVMAEPASSVGQWKFVAAKPSAPKVLRKAYGSKSGTAICAIGSSVTAASANDVSTEDQRVIEKKVTLRKRMEQVKEAAAVQMPLKCQMDIGEKSNQADEQKAKKTMNAIAAAFSTQSVSVDVPENTNLEEKKKVVRDAISKAPLKGITSATANLLAQLQLPPTVSARVDKIIASGQNARLQKLNDQRARMKAHLDRQIAGVLPDDDDGHLVFKKNDILHGRWELREELGEGTFGRVIKAYDKQRDKMRAVKIVRNVHKYRDAAYLEIKVLTKLKQLDPNGTQ